MAILGMLFVCTRLGPLCSGGFLRRYGHFLLSTSRLSFVIILCDGYVSGYSYVSACMTAGMDMYVLAWRFMEFQYQKM